MLGLEEMWSNILYIPETVPLFDDKDLNFVTHRLLGSQTLRANLYNP